MRASTITARRQWWMANMFLTEMSLIGGARTGTGDSGSGYASLVVAITVFFMSVDLWLAPRS